MSVEIKLGTDIRWGTSSAGSVPLGKVIACSNTETPKEVEIPDENAETYSVVFADEQHSVTLEVICIDTWQAGEFVSATECPESGVVLTGDSETGIVGAYGILVSSATELWRNNDVCKFSITGRAVDIDYATNLLRVSGLGSLPDFSMEYYDAEPPALPYWQGSPNGQDVVLERYPADAEFYTMINSTAGWELHGDAAPGASPWEVTEWTLFSGTPGDISGMAVDFTLALHPIA